MRLREGTILDFNLVLVEQFKVWLKAQKYEDRTITCYGCTAAHFSRFLKNKRLTEAKYIDVLEFLAAIAQNKSRYTVRLSLHSLRIFYDFLDFGGLITEHAPRMVRMKAIPQQVPVVLNEKQVVRLIAAARNSRDRVIAELLYATGCRPCELGRIRVEDIDFDGQKIRVSGKNKTRFVIFGTPAKRAIRAYLGGRTSGYLIDDGNPKQHGFVCPTSRSWMLHWRVYSGPHQYVKHSHYIPVRFGASRKDARAMLKRLTRNVDLSRPPAQSPKKTECIRDAIKAMAARAGMPWVCPSMLRHCFATHLLDHDAHLRVIQNLMGHSTLRPTQIYTHVSRTDLRKVYDRCHPRAKG
jgi:site-specific recombinase XerD